MEYLDSIFGVHGKVALVTGGATGLGQMIATGLVAGGAHVLIASRKVAACEVTASKINEMSFSGKVEALQGDVSTEEGIVALRKAVSERTDKLHILVNNAGISWGEPLAQFPHDQWARVMGVNVAGVFTLTRELLPMLRQSATDGDPARIINIGSIMGTVPATEGAYSYTMSKAAVHHMTKVFANEFASQNITANALAPGPFPSQMTAFALGRSETADRVASNVPLGRNGQPDDAAGAVLFLCSRAGSYVSGAILPLDGGMSASNPVNLFANAMSPQE